MLEEKASFRGEVAPHKTFFMNNKITNTATSTNKAFKKGRSRAEGILFPPKNKGQKTPSWSKRVKNLVTLIEGAGTQQRRGIADMLFGRSFALIQIRDEQVWQKLREQLGAVMEGEMLLRGHVISEILEAEGPKAKLAVLNAWDKTLLTEPQAAVLRGRYQAKLVEAAAAKALRGLQLTRHPQGRRGKPQPLAPAILANAFFDGLPEDIDLEAAKRAVARIARGDQAKSLPAKAAALANFWRAAEKRRQESLAKLSA